jgi:7-carboxy-7-deazaguanine synthase
MKTLNVHSIFTSIDGEVSAFGQGRLSTFIRLAGCYLSCTYCDSPTARDSKNGITMSIDSIMEKIKNRKVNKVTITGGEPLLQDNVFELTSRLYQEEIDVSIETNGSIVPFGNSVGSFIVDYKLPSSDMEHHMIMDAFKSLRKCDFIKFVIKDNFDYQVAVDFANIIRLSNKLVRFAFSPLRGSRFASNIQLLINDLSTIGFGDAYINVQLHKFLNLE